MSYVLCVANDVCAAIGVLCMWTGVHSEDEI